MFGSLKTAFMMELQTNRGIHVELSALQNGYLEFSEVWVFDKKKHYILKNVYKIHVFFKIYKNEINVIHLHSVNQHAKS